MTKKVMNEAFFWGDIQVCHSFSSDDPIHFCQQLSKAVGGEANMQQSPEMTRYFIPFVRNVLELKFSSTGHKLTFLNWIGAEFI